MTSSVYDWSTTAASNTLVAGVSIAEGFNPANINDAMRAIMAASKGEFWVGTSGGTANAQTVSLTPAPAAYAAGMVIAFIVGTANTGATTLNVNSLGTKNIYYRNRALFGGELVANDLVVVVYDGTQFQLLRSGSKDIVQQQTATYATATSNSASSWADTGLSVSITPRISTRIMLNCVTSGVVSVASGNNAAGAYRLYNSVTATQLAVADLQSNVGGATSIICAAPVSLHSVDTSGSLGVAQTIKLQQFRVTGDTVTSFYFNRTGYLTATEVL